MLNFIFLYFTNLFNKFDIEVSAVSSSGGKEQPKPIASREDYSRDRPHMKNDQNCDSKDLKALTRSGEKLAATASLWLDKTHWD